MSITSGESICFSLKYVSVSAFDTFRRKLKERFVFGLCFIFSFNCDKITCSLCLGNGKFNRNKLDNIPIRPVHFLLHSNSILCILLDRKFLNNDSCGEIWKFAQETDKYFDLQLGNCRWFPRFVILLLDPACNEFSFNDRKITTNRLLCIKIIDPNVKKFNVRQPLAYNKKNLYLSVPPQGSNQCCFCENKKAFQLNANHSHWGLSEQVRTYLRGSQYSDLPYVGPRADIMTDRKDWKLNFP